MFTGLGIIFWHCFIICFTGLVPTDTSPESSTTQLQNYINLYATAQSRGDQLAQQVLRIEAQMKIDIVCVKEIFKK